MRAKLRAVEAEQSEKTVAALEALLAQAKQGEIVGLAYAAIHPGREYTTGVVGEAGRSLTFSRGMIATLDDFLIDLDK